MSPKASEMSDAVMIFSREDEEKMVDYIIKNKYEKDIEGAALWKLLK